MRHRAVSIIATEVAILEASTELKRAGQDEVDGYLLAKRIRELRQARRLTAYGRLYNALTRLERLGYLASRWEEPHDTAAQGQPRRRLYRLTLVGEGALSAVRAADRGSLTNRPAAAGLQ